MVKLFCAVVGAAESAFPVDIDGSQSVGDLKKAIKAENEDIKCPARQLQLYLAKKGDAWLTQKQVEESVDDTSDFKLLKVVAAPLQLVGLSEKDVAFELTMEDVETMNTPVHVLVVVPTEALSTAVAKKRKLAEVRELITPSSFAKCKGGGSWVKWLKKLNGQIECHRIDRSDDETPIPLVLLNKTFARFEENCKKVEIGSEDCEFVIKLCHGMSIPYESEAELADKARNLLNEYLLVDYPASTITPATVNGSVSDGSYRFGETLLFNLECKLQKGDGGGDPTMQNVAYYIKNLPNVIHRQFPCFLVDICGPLMSVFGIVNTGDEDAICEPLVMSFPLLFFDNEWLMVSLARVCASLKIALRELTEECHQLVTSRRNLSSANDLDRLRFPYQDFVEFNGAIVSLRYVEVIQRFVFVAKLQDGSEVIVKFTKRYGQEVHQYCSDAGFAPALLCCETLPSGWTFVVMERLSLISLERAETDQTMVRDQLCEIESGLAAAAFVHGDLRDSNVMWDPVKNRVVLVDFDWSGKDGADTYPPFMNAEIAWPPGAETGKPLRCAHDAYWLDSMKRRLQFK
uniref:Crinkler n=1 Tax=Lagenidium giganteum TaxID=4803 RepID=W0G8K2_9STRA|nr:crinkler [Lagenidium giganteum]